MFGLDFVGQDAVDDGAADGSGGSLGALGEAGNVDDPGGGFFGEHAVQQDWLAADLFLDGFGEAAGIDIDGQGGVAEGGESPASLASPRRTAFCIALDTAGKLDTRLVGIRWIIIS